MTTIKEVYFDQYCKTCKSEAVAEDKEPCNECLNNPINYDSHKPLNYSKATK